MCQFMSDVGKQLRKFLSLFSLQILFLTLSFKHLILHFVNWQGVDVDEKANKMDAAKLFGANTPTVSCHFSRE